MNRYIAAGLLADMREGRTVLYLGQGLHTAGEALATMEPLLRSYERVRRANGRQEVASPPTGGRVMLRSVASGIRGGSYDVVVIDAEPTPRQLEEIIPAVARTGELIRA